MHTIYLGTTVYHYNLSQVLFLVNRLKLCTSIDSRKIFIFILKSNYCIESANFYFLIRQILLKLVDKCNAPFSNDLTHEMLTNIQANTMFM